MEDDHFRLPVGYFSRRGGEIEYEEIEGHALAEHDGGSSAAEASPGHVVVLRERLFRSPGDGPFIVHTLLELSGSGHPLLGRLERYGRWSEVMLHHPDLARSAGYALAPDPWSSRPWRPREAWNSTPAEDPPPTDPKPSDGPAPT